MPQYADDKNHSLIRRHKLEHVTDSIGERSMKSYDIRNFDTRHNYQSKERRLISEQAAAVKQCILNHKKATELVFV